MDIKWLEVAIKELDEGNPLDSIEALQEFEYILLETERTELIEECLLITCDAVECIDGYENDIASTYMYILVGMLTLEQDADYVPTDEIQNIILEMTIERDKLPVSVAEIGMQEINLRRLNNKLVKAMRDEHDRRYGLRHD